MSRVADEEDAVTAPFLGHRLAEPVQAAGALGVGELAVVELELEVVVELQGVDDELVRADVAFHGFDPQRLADRTVRAVGTEKVLGAHRELFAGLPVLHCGCDTGTVLLEADQLVAEVHRHVAGGFDLAVEGELEVVLVEDPVRPVAVGGR